MTKLSAILSLIVAGELVACAAVLSWWGAGSRPIAQPPQPDLSFLDPVSAQEVRERQQGVADGTADAWRALGEIYVLYGLFQEAEVCCRRAAELDPRAFWTYLWWGTALSRLGRTVESSEVFRTAIGYAEGSLANTCWYCIGMNLLREEKAVDAEAAFRAAPRYAPADYELARLLARSNRWADAVSILDRLIAAFPEREKFLQLRARAARATGDLAAAELFEDRADRASEVLSSDELTGFLVDQVDRHGLATWVQQGKDLLANGSPEAATVLRNVLEVEFRRDAADLLATVELSLGRAEEAMQVLSTAIARNGPSPRRLVLLGDAALARGDSQTAHMSWERAARMRTDRLAHERMAQLASLLGDDGGARRHHAVALYAAGVAAERSGQLTEAAHSLEQAVSLDPDRVHAWFHLGECRRLLGDVNAAREAYDRCLALDPLHGRARRGIQRLETTQ